MDVAHKDATSVVHDIQQDAFVVERARELLTHWFEVSAADAELLLRSWSRQTRTPLHSVAAALTSDIFEGRPTGCAPKVLRHLELSLRQLPCAGNHRCVDRGQRGQIERSNSPLLQNPHNGVGDVTGVHHRDRSGSGNNWNRAER